MMEFQQSQYGSFGGLHKSSIPINQADLIIVGIPYDSAASGKKGTASAPSILRLLSKDLQTVTRRNLSLKDFIIRDVGDIYVHPTNDQQNFNQIKSSMQHIYSSSKSPVLVIGGDHSITFPEFSALCEDKKLGVIWIDAHRDLLDSLQQSKYSHGCSLRRLIENQVLPENVLLIGTRYFTDEESKFVENMNIREIPMSVIEDTNNCRKLIQDAILKLSKDVDILAISIDIDGLDPSTAPGTGTPVSGGLSANLLLNIIHDFPVPFRAIDIVEVSPPLDTPGRITTKLQMALITEICGKIQEWTKKSQE